MTKPCSERLPWASWFVGLDTDEGLCRRVTRRVDPLEGLRRLSPELACSELRESWRRGYLPSKSHLALLRRLVDRVRVGAGHRIPSISTYEAAVYAREPIIPDDQEIWGITGPAGAGKTSTINGLLRLFSLREEDRLTPHMPMTPQPVIHITMKSLRSISPVLRSIANPVFVAGRTNIAPAELVQHLREWLFNRGTQLIVVDELQSMTRGADSTTLIANLVTELNDLGASVAYVFNYSLGHKLLRRQQEDKDRLLVRCLQLEPCSADDPHWQAVVAEHVRAERELIGLDPARDAPELHRLTAGNYRLLRILLLEACRTAWPSQVGKRVTMVNVRSAYESGAFASQRADVEALRSLQFSARLRDHRKDLVCPFPTESAIVAASTVGSTQRRAQDEPPTPAALHLVESALGVDARRVLKTLRAEAGESVPAARKTATVTRLPRRGPLTAEALLAGAKMLSDTAAKPKSAPKGELAPED